MKQVSPRCSNTFVAFDTPGITQYARINICQCDHWPFWAQASMSIESHLWKWPEPLGPQPARGRVPSPHLTWCPETSPPPPIPLICQPNCPPPPPPYSLLVHLPGHRITIKSVNWLPLLSSPSCTTLKPSFEWIFILFLFKIHIVYLFKSAFFGKCAFWKCNFLKVYFKCILQSCMF